MKSELLHIGPLTVYSYGTMIAIGILAAYFVSDRQAKRRGMDRDALLSLAIWCAAGGIFGAKVMYWIVEWRSILEDPGMLLRISDGFVVYGGILAGIFCGWLFTHRRRLSFPEYADIILPSVALAQGFGRIGCFLSGCCYGKPAKGFLAVTFTDSMFAPNWIPLIPTQLISSVLDFTSFGILTFLLGKRKRTGFVSLCYLLFYSTGRFVLEFFRGDLARGQIGPLSTSQFISVFIFLAAAVGLARNSAGEYN